VLPDKVRAALIPCDRLVGIQQQPPLGVVMRPWNSARAQQQVLQAGRNWGC